MQHFLNIVQHCSEFLVEIWTPQHLWATKTPKYVTLQVLSSHVSAILNLLIFWKFVLVIYLSLPFIFTHYFELNVLTQMLFLLLIFSLNRASVLPINMFLVLHQIQIHPESTIQNIRYFHANHTR